MLTLENVIPIPALFSVTGDVTLSENPLPTDPIEKLAPVSIAQKGDTVYAHFNWTQSGFLCNFLDSDDKWVCAIYLEQMGPGEVAANPTAKKVDATSIDGHTYDAPVEITNLPVGVYKVMATLTLHANGGTPTPIAAYEELGVLQVYEFI